MPGAPTPMVGGGADIRSMTPDAPAQGGGGGEMLSSLDGFDTTFGPGADVPEPFQRAHESVTQHQEESLQADGGEAGAAHNPYQPPGAAMAVSNRAGFGLRLLALIIDWLWMAGLGAAAAFLAPTELQLFVGAGVGLLNFSVVLVGWSVWGTTPGKRVLGLYVCNDQGKPGIGFGRAILRMVAYVVSAIPLFIGFLLALGKDRLALHDRITGTSVRRL